MKQQFNHGGFMAELRKRRRTIPADLYRDLMASLDIGLRERTPPPRSARNLVTGEPAWLAEARTHMGLKEIPGRKHNSKILGWVNHLGGWFKDDETPWCGTFVGYCMKVAGHPVAKHWYRAKDWMNWGKDSPARIGAIAVFGRSGGGHVGFIVGESATNLYILGGNQSNMVSITPIAKSRLIGIRWPEGLPLNDAKPVRMAGGTVSRNEA